MTLLANRQPQPDDHVLIVLGHHGHPTFKAIGTDEAYLNTLGTEIVARKNSQYSNHTVITSNNVFTLTNPDYAFDQALDQIIRDLILKNDS